MPVRKASSPSPVVKSADRTLDIFELVGSAPYQLTFGRIVSELGIPKGSLSRLLGNLVDRGYLDVDPATSRYGLGHRLHALASEAESGLSPRQIVRAGLEELRDRFNETAALFERRGDEVEVVDRAQTQHPLQYTLAVGDRAPLFAHTAGKVVLSHMSDDELADYLDRVRLVRFGPNTLLTRNALRRSVLDARASGMIFGSEELAAGVCGYSIPIVVGGSLVAVLNVVIPLLRYDEKVAADIESHLPRVARRISQTIERSRAVG